MLYNCKYMNLKRKIFLVVIVLLVILDILYLRKSIYFENLL